MIPRHKTEMMATGLDCTESRIMGIPHAENRLALKSNMIPRALSRFQILLSRVLPDCFMEFTGRNVAAKMLNPERRVEITKLRLALHQLRELERPTSRSTSALPNSSAGRSPTEVVGMPTRVAKSAARHCASTSRIGGAQTPATQYALATAFVATGKARVNPDAREIKSSIKSK